MSDKDDVGWSDETQEVNDNRLVSLPKDWKGYTKAAKVQKIVDVVLYQIQKVRSGNFDLAKASHVAALALEGQIEMAEFYADAESNAKDAKHMVDYIENESASNYKMEACKEKEKITETEIKRRAIYAPEVKESRKRMVELEKEFKKWKYIYDSLKEAHIFFRSLGKV